MPDRPDQLRQEVLAPWWDGPEWFAAIVDSSDDAIVGKTLDSVIRSWNAGAERIFGYSAGEIVGKSILTIIPPDRQHEEPNIIARLTRGERIDHYETVRVTKAGDLIDVSISVSPIRDANGAIIGAAKIARDITESNRLRSDLVAQTAELEMQVEEAQALQEELETTNEELARSLDEADALRQAAEQASQAKSQFLTTMSHELRTPLNAIGGYVELMELGLRGPVTDEQRADFARIKRSQQVLLRLIEDVLDHAKIEAGGMVLSIVDLPLRPLLEGMESLVAPLIDRKGLRYALTVEGTPVVRADATKVEQILLNLLSNAIKFTDHGGVEIHCRGRETHVDVEVRDTGRGVPPDMLDAIFDPFVQVDSNLTRTAEGTGLGLAISRQLARAMGGELTAASSGGGSTFTLRLPST